MNIKLFRKFQSLTKNFENLNSEIIKENPEILKVLRLSLGISIHEFEKKFGMYQQSRYERGLYKPNKRKIEEFLKKSQRVRNIANFDYSYIELLDKEFLEKERGGAKVGQKTLFTKDDKRTIELSRKGARSGGLTTINKYDKNHMTLLAKQIKRGRKENQGFRSRAEMLVAQTLDELNIKYEYEKPVNGFLPDFQLKENKLLEVMCYTSSEYLKNQVRRINALKDFEILIVTNKPEFFNSFGNGKIRIVKFSKSHNILKNRLKELL